jgi:hypothetical protein
MKQVRRLLAELMRDTGGADVLRDDPDALARTLELRDELLDGLRSADRFFVDERPVIDALIAHTTGPPPAPNSDTPKPASAHPPQHSCGCEATVATIMGDLTSAALKAIETIESIHRHRHVDGDHPKLNHQPNFNHDSSPAQVDGLADL